MKASIYIKKNEFENNPARASFSKAHELCHFVLHQATAHEYKPVRFRSSEIKNEENVREREAKQYENG